jgi:hypothetical protein
MAEWTACLPQAGCEGARRRLLVVLLYLVLVALVRVCLSEADRLDPYAVVG